MTTEHDRFQEEQRRIMMEGIEVGRRAAEDRRKELVEQERRLRADPKLLLEEVKRSIHRLADAFEANQRESQAPQSVKKLLLNPDDALYFEIDRFQFLRRIAKEAKVTLRVPGFGKARELVAATNEIYREEGRVNNPTVIFPTRRQIPAGRALQKALGDSSQLRTRRGQP